MNIHLPVTTPWPVYTVRCELSGDNVACAAGITVTSTTPVLSLCRSLTEAGHGAARLECYRGGVLALVVRSVAEGAALEINGEGNGFRPLREPDAGSPMRRNGRGAV